MAVHVLENDELRVTVSDAGAELTGVYDKARCEERIWTGDAAVWNRHAPILFPFVGKVTDGVYRANGCEYPMKTQHGFARDMTFECGEETGLSVVHSLASDAGTREIYPWDFRLTVRHSLEPDKGRRVRVEWTVENTGGERMYYSIGGHPAFMTPRGSRKEDCYILFPGMRELRYITTGKAGYALPRLGTILPKDGRVRYREDIPDTWIFEDGQVKRVGIAGPDGEPWAMMDCTGFPMLAVWANPNGPFICLEPWFGRTDDEGFCGDIRQKKGIQSLEAGEARKYAYSMELL